MASKIGGALALAGVAYVGFRFAVHESEPPTKDPREDAWGMCQHFVGERLKSPMSAVFRPGLDAVRPLGGHRYQCVGTVDSKNPLGVVLRTEFDLTVRDKQNGTWALEKIGRLE